MIGLLGKSMSAASYRIGGHSKIVSGNGEVIAEMKEMALADIYSEVSSKLVKFREKIQKNGGLELRYNSISSSGTADTKVRREQFALLSEIRMLEEKAVETASGILKIAGSG